MTPYRHILVPVDGSEISDRGLDEAIAIARTTGATVRVVHVVDDLTWAGARSPHALDAEAVDRLLRQAGGEIVRRALARVEGAGVPAESALHDDLRAHLPDVIEHHARSWPADLVVVGTHGRRGLDRFFLGSGAETIARTAPVPVLLVRPGADEGVPSRTHD